MGVSGETRASLSGAGDGDETYCATCSRSFDMQVTHCPDDGTKLVRFKATADALIGKVLDGRYQIQKPLGEGGMGTVYRGMQLSVDREVAIKVVHPSIAVEREAAKRFLREARLSSRLNAPNIVNVYDFGQSDEGVLYLVMELVKGQTLQEILRANTMLYPPRAANIVLQMCDALETAHQVGIVHRDLKPGNVIVLDDPPGRDHIKVLDFGLAKSVGHDAMSGITNTHAMLGTPVYMAPEQIEGAAVDARTDLYSLGCMFYELLTGAPPFTDNAISTLFAKHLHESPAPLPDHVPPAFAEIVMRLLAKNPADRFATANALRERLARAIAQTPAAVLVNRGSSPIVHGLSGSIPAQTPAQVLLGFAPTCAYTPAGSVGSAPYSSQLDGARPKSRRVAVIAGSAALALMIGVVVIALRADDTTSSNGTNTVDTVDMKAIGADDTKPIDTKPSDTKPVDTKTVDTKTVDTKTVDTKTVDTKTVDTKTVDATPAGTKPVETKPGGKPTRTKPTDAKPKPADTKPTGTKPTKDPDEELPFLTPK